MNKTVRYMIYAIITVVCILAIFAGVYVVVFKKQTVGNVTNGQDENNTTVQDPQFQVKSEFKELFQNYFVASNYKATNIKKISEDKDLVYEGITYKETQNGNLDLHVPLINIQSEIIERYNTTTQSIFVEKANEIMQDKETLKDTIYSISFTSYINNDILSVAIMANLKEGQKAQKTMLQTYNYNLLTGEEVTINDIIRARGLDVNVINKKITDEVKKANDDALGISSSGYEVYKRDLTSDMYKVENVSIFMQGPNGELYIVYPYGNVEYTTEMDVIQI